jgi:ketosteroid isomerase-like protein
MIRVLFTLLCCLSLAACFSGVDLEEEKLRILETDKEFSKYSMENSSSEAFYLYMDSDGTVLPQKGYPLVGKEAFGKLLTPKTEGGSTSTLEWEPDSVEISQSGDLGYTFGRYESTVVNEQGEEIKTYGHYVTIWKKQPDGSWKFVFDTGNENSALEKEWLETHR